MLKTELGEVAASASAGCVLLSEVKERLGEVVAVVSEEAERERDELLELALLALLEAWAFAIEENEMLG